MPFQTDSPGTCRRGPTAFSLIEVIVVTGLLSVIILGLVLMFGQTQRAYKLGTTQVDVLEGGRMVTDMLTRDLQQTVPTGQPAWVNIVNFYVGLPNFAPLEQELPGSANRRTNLMEETFFLTKENQQWTAVGYFVRTNDSFNALGFPAGSGGSLYRFETNYSDAVFRQNPGWCWRDFNAALTNGNRASRILEGVVHFTIRGFTPDGEWIATNRLPNIFMNFPASPVTLYPFGETPYLYFISNAVPAAVEIELGILEAREVERARSITSPNARSNFLAQQAGKTHLFRWRVPVRNVDPAVYQ